DIKPGSETTSQAANEVEDQSEAQVSTPGESGAPRKVSIKVDTKTNMLGVFENEKLIAAYPVTIGSAQTASPIGDWKIRGIAKLPKFRYDKEMLKHGERSGNFYMLAPGPRNPVGVMWIALNKKGIGIHGTNDPDSIGRAVSHGCIRLANWDVVRLATKIKAGDNVSIH
ncbi:MAG TPA: L,D-transpeptidase, partial [Candidatus Udaeobacter sp.]|nr:L,D-transpeptidase [Candidatus Udaeobacter sp.]